MSKTKILDKEKKLLETIEKAKKDLMKLQEKQKAVIGSIAYKYNLNNLGMSFLEKEFEEIAKKHKLI